jgi:uncharacterized protein (TIGR02246 family)
MKRIKVHWLVAATAMAMVVQIAALAQPTASSDAEESISPDEQQIRQGVINFVEFYNARKIDELIGLFAADARFVARDGSETNGQEEIRQAFEETFSSSPQGKISVSVDSIRFLTPEVAVEEGATNLFPDGETLTTSSRYSVLHLKKEGRWRMQSVRVVEEEVLSAYAQLQALEWLVGDWVDEGRDDVVETSFRWDENKSFLLEEFRVVREGSVVLKGSQRIGWDPRTKQIRSWIFDTSGGFGQALWSPTGVDSWICKAEGVSSEGEMASATRRLSRVSQDLAVASSTDRILANEPLPSVETTMVRKPPAAQSQ